MITLKAWAKINLGLKILNKRDDGFHNIETTLTTTNLADFIRIEETDSGIIIDTQGLNMPAEENLCYQAADLFKKKYGVEKGVRINLIKNIPIGGGLGGGSSDAAAVLKGMRELYALNINDEELMELSKDIGLDVPFFIKGGAAYARGKGDELKFFKLPRMSLIIYYPGYSISTKWAYQAYDEFIVASPQPDPEVFLEKDSGKKKNKKERKGFPLANDFEKVIFKHHPDLVDVKTRLLMAGCFLVSLSGSGSCLYTLNDESMRDKALAYLAGIGAQYFEVSTI